MIQNHRESTKKKHTLYTVFLISNSESSAILVPYSIFNIFMRPLVKIFYDLFKAFDLPYIFFRFFFHSRTAW